MEESKYNGRSQYARYTTSKKKKVMKREESDIKRILKKCKNQTQCMNLGWIKDPQTNKNNKGHLARTRKI